MFWASIEADIVNQKKVRQRQPNHHAFCRMASLIIHPLLV